QYDVERRNQRNAKPRQREARTPAQSVVARRGVFAPRQVFEQKADLVHRPLAYPALDDLERPVRARALGQLQGELDLAQLGADRADQRREHLARVRIGMRGIMRPQPVEHLADLRHRVLVGLQVFALGGQEEAALPGLGIGEAGGERVQARAGGYGLHRRLVAARELAVPQLGDDQYRGRDRETAAQCDLPPPALQPSV